MRLFAELFRRIDETNKKNEKYNALVEYFDKADDKDKVWTIALFSNQRPKRSITTNLLSTWACELANIPVWLFDESQRLVGDLTETISLILPKNEIKDERKLHEWISFIQELKDQEEIVKEHAIKEAWRNLGTQERLVLNKLITGGFRVKVSQKIITSALAQHLDKEENEIAHRLMGDWTPEVISFKELFLKETVSANISRPYPFYLAYHLEETPKELGAPNEWAAEWKWDGIRGQLIKRNDEVFVWSGDEELVTDQFPELKEMGMLLDNGTVIDAEILVIKDGEIMAYHLLQKRFGKKKVTKKMLTEYPIAMMAYDLLEFESIDIRQLPYLDRRNKLLQILAQCNDHRLTLSEDIEFDDWNYLTNERKKSRSKGAKGLILKHRSSPYQSGRKKGNWWKWKVDPFTIDAVLIYAQRSQGRKMSLFFDFTFAVWDGDLLIPIAKAYDGLSDQEITEITKFVKGNTIEKFGPVRSVNPELIFQLSFEDIHESSRHKCGLALRFPMIKQWHKDKIAREANSLADLKQLMNK